MAFDSGGANYIDNYPLSAQVNDYTLNRETCKLSKAPNQTLRSLIGKTLISD